MQYSGGTQNNQRVGGSGGQAPPPPPAANIRGNPPSTSFNPQQRILGQNNFAMNKNGGGFGQQNQMQNQLQQQQQQHPQQYQQQSGFQQNQMQATSAAATSTVGMFSNGLRTCKWHKGQVYIAICSSETCRMGRLCCLRCMVSKHTDHTQQLILLDELRDSDLGNLSVPTNWALTLGGGLKEDIQQIIGVCRVSSFTNAQDTQIEELAKIDETFDTLTKEVVEEIEKLRTFVKDICREKSEGSAERLQKLVNTLRKILSPEQILTIVDQFILQASENNEQIKTLSLKTASNPAILHSHAEQALEEELNGFFTAQRVTQEDSDLVYRNYQFLCKQEAILSAQSNNSAGGSSAAAAADTHHSESQYINWTALNEVREQILNITQNKQKFSEIFFPDSVLFNKYDNLEKVRSLTNVYDEITVPTAGSLTSVEAIDSERFMVVRESELMEIWNIEEHRKEFSYFIAGMKTQICPVKTRGRLLVAFVLHSSSSSVQIADTGSRKVIKHFSLPCGVKSLKVLSARDASSTVVDQLLLSVLLENGEVKVINVSKNQIIDLRNKNTAFMEVLPEVRCYQQSTGEEVSSSSSSSGNGGNTAQPQTSPQNGIVSSNGLVTASNDLISVWYPLSSRCVRNIKVILRPNESVKQIGSLEMTQSEKQQTYFADSVAGCPSRTAIALLTNKSLRIFNWFKANCIREIIIEDCNNFHILQTFVQNELKNVFFLYNVGENKPAEYATCDWSTQKVDYWNSGSLSNFSCVKTLNQFKILEIGKYNIKNSDSKKHSQQQQQQQQPSAFEIRARIKSLN